MEDNIFLRIKAAVTLTLSAFGVAFGWLGWLIMVWVAVMLIDYLSGSSAAWADHEWSSARAREGLWHKAGMIFAVGAAGLTDFVLALVWDNLPMGAMPFKYVGLLLPLTLGWYILTELGSILENAAKMGAPVPEILTKALAMAKDAVDGPNDKGE